MNSVEGTTKGRPFVLKIPYENVNTVHRCCALVMCTGTVPRGNQTEGYSVFFIIRTFCVRIRVFVPGGTYP
jgi:hypothetical protein